MRRALALLLFLAGGCALRPDLYTAVPESGGLRPDLFVVLPGPKGHVGSITVAENETATPVALTTALAAAQIGRKGRLERVAITQEQVDEIFGDALVGLPKRPQHFLLHFQEGTDTLTEDSVSRLPEVLAEVKSRPQVQVEVIGHTDRRGAHDMNVELSKRRAEAVRQLLIRDGLPESAITSIGRGELDPLVPTEDDIAEPRNRRVEVTVR